MLPDVLENSKEAAQKSRNRQQGAPRFHQRRLRWDWIPVCFVGVKHWWIIFCHYVVRLGFNLQKEEPKPASHDLKPSSNSSQDRRHPNEDHATTPDDRHHSEMIASDLSALLDNWSRDATQSLATASQTNEGESAQRPLTHETRTTAGR